jgi:benzoyl-CoA reductase/2-hydroxyglutaryl-CoA dehydratase subunit BcrC/BadD/HgdB
MIRTYDIWVHTLKFKYSHLIDLPHSSNGEAPTFYKAVLQSFRESLAGYVGREITDADLSIAVRDYNNYRRKVHDLYDLCKCRPPQISGTMVTKTLVAGLGLPVGEATELVESVIREVRDRPPVGSGQRPRLLLFGAEQDSADFIRIVEDAGADVVMGYFCPGAREYGTLVPVTDDPMTGIADRYLNLNCARTYQGTGDSGDPLEARFGEIRRLATEFGAEGIVLMIRRCCDPFGFEVPALKRYFESHGLRTLYLEDEYTPAGGRLATRIQAFLEMLPRGIGQ